MENIPELTQRSTEGVTDVLNSLAALEGFVVGLLVKFLVADGASDDVASLKARRVISPFISDLRTNIIDLALSLTLEARMGTSGSASRTTQAESSLSLFPSRSSPKRTHSQPGKHVDPEVLTSRLPHPVGSAGKSPIRAGSWGASWVQSEQDPFHLTLTTRPSANDGANVASPRVIAASSLTQPLSYAHSRDVRSKDPTSRPSQQSTSSRSPSFLSSNKLITPTPRMPSTSSEPLRHPAAFSAGAVRALRASSKRQSRTTYANPSRDVHPRDPSQRGLTSHSRSRKAPSPVPFPSGTHDGAAPLCGSCARDRPTSERSAPQSPSPPRSPSPSSFSPPSLSPPPCGSVPLNTSRACNARNHPIRSRSSEGRNPPPTRGDLVPNALTDGRDSCPHDPRDGHRRLNPPPALPFRRSAPFSGDGVALAPRRRRGQSPDLVQHVQDGASDLATPCRVRVGPDPRKGDAPIGLSYENRAERRRRNPPDQSTPRPLRHNAPRRELASPDIIRATASPGSPHALPSPEIVRILIAPRKQRERGRGEGGRDGNVSDEARRAIDRRNRHRGGVRSKDDDDHDNDDNDHEDSCRTEDDETYRRYSIDVDDENSFDAEIVPSARSCSRGPSGSPHGSARDAAQQVAEGLAVLLRSAANVQPKRRGGESRRR